MNFASDNTAPASPEILAALSRASEGAVSSYGADPITARVREKMDAVFGRPVATYPVATGTAANALALATIVRPFGAVICAEEAHIATDECGAPEFYMGGAKLITLPSEDGRITPAQIDAAMARAIDGGVHHVLPEAVSITQATEWGTVYTQDQIAAIAAACRRHGLKLHMDGARFGNALAHLGCPAAAISWQAAWTCCPSAPPRTAPSPPRRWSSSTPPWRRGSSGGASAPASSGPRCVSCRRSWKPISTAICGCAMPPTPTPWRARWPKRWAPCRACD
jgi:hypothetical protein